MKTIILIFILCFSTILWGEEITDFNAPLWDYGTGDGADATGTGTLGGVPFNMSFSLNGGTKLFDEAGVKTNQHTSNSTIGHGGHLGSLLLGGSGEGLSITFKTPITVILGFSHVNVSTDGWDFLTPADEIASLHSEHVIYEAVGGSGSLDGVRQGAVTADINSISYFKWNNVTTINLQTSGSAGTTLAFSSMRDVPPHATLELTKTLSSENGSVTGFVEAGETLTYSITLSNFSGVDGSFTIDEKVPTGTAFVAAGNDFTCVDGAAAGSICSFSMKLPSLGSTTKTFIVKANTLLTTTSIENFVIERGTAPPICSATDSSDSRCVSTAVAVPEITLQKTSQTHSDPVNGTTNPKAIPGALAEYILTVANSGSLAPDNNSIVLSDAVPMNTALYVNDISGAGTGPIRFVDGTSPNAPSGLSYNFVNLDSITDSLSFSNDGGTSFNYTPSPDADGTDTNVTNIRIATLGQFLAPSGSGNPSFQLKFRVKVK